MDKKITLVIVGGIRTHYIKINAIQKVLNRLDVDLTSKFKIIYVDAAQHYDQALTGFIDELKIHFDYRLHHDTKESFRILSSMFEKLGNTFDLISSNTKVDYVIVMGDVATTAVAALVAIAKRIKLIHIESGTRIGRGNGNEEYYRIMADNLSTICFASTQMDYKNLIAEGFENRAYFSGDVIYDYIKNEFTNLNANDFSYFVLGVKKQFFYQNSDYVLASLHHAENLEYDTLQNLFFALEEFGKRSIFIAHPQVLRLIKDLSVNTFSTIVADGIPYLDNLCAIGNCRFVITDSGGIQREAYYFNKRCIVRSDLTIWKPIVEIGSNITAGKTTQELMNAILWAENCRNEYFPYNNCFGDGKALRYILERILEE